MLFSVMDVGAGVQFLFVELTVSGVLARRLSCESLTREEKAPALNVQVAEPC